MQSRAQQTVAILPIALLLFAGPAQAQVSWDEFADYSAFYVSASATGGGDGSYGNEFTLAEALSNASAGEVFYFEPGTYEITSKETNFAECGMCIRLFEVSGGSFSKAYMPVAGSGYVELTEVTLGAAGDGELFAGSFNLDLQEISLSDMSTPVSGGCVGASKYAWSGTMELPPQIPDVGDPIVDATFTGFADADVSNLIDVAEQVDVDFSFTSIFEDTGKKSLVVLLGREL